jgi:hypothetical protein
MAFATHVNVEIFTDSRTGFEVVSTAAVNSNFNVIWMDLSFHNFASAGVPPPDLLPGTAPGSFLGGAMLSEITLKANKKAPAVYSGLAYAVRF